MNVDENAARTRHEPPDVIPYLSAVLSAAVLSSLDESGVPVGTDDAVVEAGAVHVVHRVLGVLAEVELHEAEAARRPEKNK